MSEQGAAPMDSLHYGRRGLAWFKNEDFDRALGNEAQAEQDERMAQRWTE